MSKASEAEKAARLGQVLDAEGYDYVRFNGGVYMRYPGSHGWVEFNDEEFGRMFLSTIAMATHTQINDYAQTVQLIAPDATPESGHLIAIGDRLWDMNELEWSDSMPSRVVYSTNYDTNIGALKAVDKFLLELANGDEELAFDYVQALAPIFMKRRPLGVIWFVGDGANGKSALIKALRKIIPRFCADLTVADIEDGKRAPKLNGKLANVVTESSEQRVEDASTYKAVGAHESFSVRKLHTHQEYTITGDVHHVFNANNIPTFSDKTNGSRRRTLVIPFPAHFEDDPTFEDRTFTDEFLGGLLFRILEATKTIRDNNYKYKWSDATILAKRSYDNDVNTAEAYLRHLLDVHVIGFSNFTVLKMRYDMWCSEQGYAPLGITTLRKIFLAHFSERSVRLVVNDERSREQKTVIRKRFILNGEQLADATWLPDGFAAVASKDFEEEEQVEEQTTLGVGDW